jgi:hypothetical protein
MLGLVDDDFTKSIIYMFWEKDLNSVMGLGFRVYPH